ncbi:MAG: alpha/beta fold hydrolase [Pseudomonadota bacterium]
MAKKLSGHTHKHSGEDYGGLRCGIFASGFEPHPLIRNCHLQTILPVRLLRTRVDSIARERIELPDGDFVDIDWMGSDEIPVREGRDIVLLLHGLTGSSSSQYIQSVASALLSSELQPVALNFRGASGEINRMPYAYHSGHTVDIDFILRILSDRFPASKLFVAGFSLGANALLKYLGETSDPIDVSGAVAVSVPYQLDRVARHLDRPAAAFYRRSLMKSMKAFIRQKASLLPREIDVSRGLQTQSFYEFDDVFTAPLNGFRDVDDYYSRSSCLQYLSSIRVPVLLIGASDDLFMPKGMFPAQDQLSDTTRLEISEHGGHVGFIGRGQGLRCKHWLPGRIIRFFDGCSD